MIFTGQQHGCVSENAIVPTLLDAYFHKRCLLSVWVEGTYYHLNFRVL